jgi:hypothetical protein
MNPKNPIGQHLTRQFIALEENLQSSHSFPFAISTRERSERGENLRFEGLESTL